MKVDLLKEPELEFGGGGRHVDIRFGLMNYGPLDLDSSTRPTRVPVGIVGTSESIEGLHSWLERCHSEVPAKESRQPNLFPHFPGFREDGPFGSTIAMERELERTISERALKELAKKTSHNAVVEAAVELLLPEMAAIAETGRAKVIFCALPESLLAAVERAGGAETKAPRKRGVRFDLHHLLKARAMGLRVPIQLMLPSTYDPTKKRRQKERPDRLRQLQDEATRAWNLHAALYYKAGGRPWRLQRLSTDLASCFVGISFYKTLDEARLETSIAQVFNERGEGVIVRGAQAAIAKEDRQPHLSEPDARSLLEQALARYRSEHKNLPARVVLHKTSNYSAAERAGFERAIEAMGIESADLLTVMRSDVRLLRRGSYPPLRGTWFELDDRRQLLYTKGSVPFFATYPGMYVPQPVELRLEANEQAPRILAQEVLSLTKLNWNDSQFDVTRPITIRAARSVGAILKYVDTDAPVEPRYSFYM